MTGSLSNSPNFIALDLRALGTQVPFVPENIELGEYTFLPFVRTGLSAGLVPPANPAVRATVPVSVTVADEKGGTKLVTRVVTLRGPGDVIGIDGAQIVRRVPSRNARDVEESFFAHVEFDRPELPWLFSPEAPVNNRLRPWIALVVVDAAVSNIEQGPGELPSRLRTKAAELPPTTEAWAWAHAQVADKKKATVSIADRLSESHALTNVSRLVCPRKLDPNTTYIAAIVPLYDAGVKSGMGTSGGTLDPAWTRQPGDADNDVVLPVYESWNFTTGAAGDFESLAKRIVPVMAPWSVGRRIIDTSNPRGRLAPLDVNDPGRLQVLRCALVSPPQAPPQGAPAEDSAWLLAKREELRKRLDEAAKAPNPNDLPRVGPRIYARWQRAQATVGAVNDGDWFPQLNTTPAHRIVAGLGTRVVRKDQEQLMQAAWVQVGEINAANMLLSRVQFARYISEALHTNDLSRLGLGELTQIVRGVQDKVRLPGSALTVHGQVKGSATPLAAMSAAFRRMTNFRGALSRFVDTAGRTKLQSMVGTDAKGFADFRRQYSEPDGVKGLSPASIAAIPIDLLAKKLNVAPAVAAKTLTTRLAARKDLSVTDRLLKPVSSWKTPPASSFDIGRIGADRVFEQASAALPTRLAADPAHADAVAPLLVGIGHAGIPELATKATDIVTRTAAASVPAAPPPFAAAVPIAAIGIQPGIIAGAATLRVQPSAAAAMPMSPIAAAPVASAIRLDPSLVGRLNPIVAAAPIAAAPIAAAPIVAAPVVVRPTFETAASHDVANIIAASRAIPAQTATMEFSALVTADGVAALPGTPARAVLGVAKGTLLQSIAPKVTLSAYARSRIKAVPSFVPGNQFANGRIDRIMAAPRFDRPMYEALDAYDRDWLVPGIGSITQTDFVTVLFTNPAFTEAFLVGLSDEMGRELLWRDYPTDQRGTYFWRFWDADHDELAQRIHAFSPTAVSTHMSASAGGSEGKVVLVVRGALLQRHPDAMILAMRAGSEDAQGHPTFIDPIADPTAAARVMFHAHLDPDITLVGFDLTAAQIQGEKWWFVIAEHPTGPRFGLDLVTGLNNPVAPTGTERNQLDWNDFTLDFQRFLGATGSRDVPNKYADNTPADPNPIHWPRSSAAIAGTLLQNPVRAAFSAKKLVGPLFTP